MSENADGLDIPMMKSKTEILKNELLEGIRSASGLEEICSDPAALSLIIEEHVDVFFESMSRQLDENLDHSKEIANIALMMSQKGEDIKKKAKKQVEALSLALEEFDALNATVEYGTTISQFTSDTAESSAEAAERGKEVVLELVGKIKKVEEIFVSSKEAMDALEISSHAIGKIVSTIEAIASQTNLLALNAAIEAARAGEQGKGFAVVASEVRGLAKETSDATKEIDSLIQTIQSQVQDAMNFIVQGTVHVAEQNSSIDQTTEGLTEILEASIQTQSLVMQIAASSEEQADGNRELQETVSQIATSAKEATEGIYNMLKFADEVSAMSNLVTWSLLQFEGKTDLTEVFDLPEGFEFPEDQELELEEEG